jgi:hypothetical protein
VAKETLLRKTCRHRKAGEPRKAGGHRKASNKTAGGIERLTAKERARNEVRYSTSVELWNLRVGPRKSIEYPDLFSVIRGLYVCLCLHS